MSIFSAVSKAFGKDVGVSRKALQDLGLAGRVTQGMRKTKIIGPTAKTKGVANLVTGMGTGRSFIKNAQYEAAHVIRGKKIVGGTAIAATGSIAMSEKRRGGMGSYRPPMPMTRGPVGSGRFA